MTESAATEIKLVPQIAAADSFRPFGEVFGGQAETEGTIEGSRFARSYPLQASSPVVLRSLRMVRRPLRFSLVEQHLALAQAFIPLKRDPAVVFVAAASEKLPAPEAFRAFVLDGTVSIMLAPGTWHSLASPMPLEARGARYLMVTDEATDLELKAHDEGRISADAMRLSRIADYKMLGVEFVLSHDEAAALLAREASRG